jgi:hypothetical protein
MDNLRILPFFLLFVAHGVKRAWTFSATLSNFATSQRSDRHIVALTD